MLLTTLLMLLALPDKLEPGWREVVWSMHYVGASQPVSPGGNQSLLERAGSDSNGTRFLYVVASFTTQLASWETARNVNVRTAAQKLSGTVLRPGEVFSFNQTVGSRTASEGYRHAPVFTPLGKLDALAGGICQLSSTLYNAALLANMQILERHPHSLTVRYLTPGRDATVSEYADLKFKNNLGYAIRIELVLDGRDVRCTITGEKPPDFAVTVEVEHRRSSSGTVRARTIRNVTREGALVLREVVSEDVYIHSR